ncbi:CLOCK-interacting pacemaker isoform X1 [Micropterus salmoides]|uniref:CLOCK-interacting pacemaker isoform X1 n=2 Tax=Micropterus salmoides TaxID=27706 RepID=UPI0018ED1425|nr:CLOCK-interacting pacemaker isoform X1 [Micropterus salmoides]
MSSMQKEQPCLSKHSPRAVSSKNAKDKSNSTTLLAMHNTKDADDSSGRGSRCSSEKDSGYSDVEDQRSNKSQYRCSERAETSQPGQNQGNLGNPTLMPAGHELPHIYIINNVTLKQPDMIQKRGQLPQRTGSRESKSSGTAHVILLQQPSLLPATLQLRKPLSRKSTATGKKIKGTYLPILNSYPRIAPHPSKKLPDKLSSKDESQNLSKRVCTEHKGDGTPVSRSPPEQHLYKQPKLAAITRDSPSSSSPTTVSSSQGSPSGTNLHSASSFLAARRLHRSGTTSTHHRRFHNTLEILRQSGLLDITLRTKELLRQSNAIERDITQLRQHTELLCQAASNPSCSLESFTDWEHLHQAMAESGSYPDLKILKNAPMPCCPDSASQPERISTGDANWPQAMENSEVPPSCLLTTIPHPNQNCHVPQQSHSEQGRELETRYKWSEKVTFVPPDSSTG